MATLWFAKALLPAGWADNVRLTLHDGRIAAVEAGVPAAPANERHAIAIPGLCNVHSHGFQRGMAGLAEYRGGRGDDFWSWRDVMYRFLNRLTPDDVMAICAMAYVEMLESGYTRVGEFHYLHNDADGARYADPAEMAGRVVEAAQETGIGLTLLPVFYAHADFGGAAPKPGQRRFISSLDGFARLLEASAAVMPADGVLGIAPHSLRAVTPEQLSALLVMRDRPESLGGPVHIHAAEQAKEVADSVAFSGQRPGAWLLDHAGVDDRWCLIHATHLDEEEAERLARSGAVAGLCPVTEANLGDGIFPAVRYLEGGGRIATGTDSNILIDPAHELRALEYSQRLSHQGRNLLATAGEPSVAGRLFRATLAGGAQALGVDYGLAAGAPADIVSLDDAHPALCGRSGDQWLDSWVFAARGSCIDAVWRGGVKRVSGGRHHAAPAVIARYRKTLARLLAA
jgi:formiminoglutamate deiminase